MTHVIIDSVLPAEVYNGILIDHDATEQAALLELKSRHIPSLAEILAVHGVSDYVELHLLHRHFALREGEAMIHKIFVTPESGGRSITVDVAKAVPCPSSAKTSLFPLMWMVSSTSGLVAYEYGALGDGSPQPQKIGEISRETWNAFVQAFCGYVHGAGIQDLISLKDKSCVAGGEYVIPSLRALFRIPYSVINLQASSGLIETGWAVEHNDTPEVNGPFSLPECTDGHVTHTKHTSGGTVATWHETTEDGADAIDAKEVDPVYVEGMWNAVKSGEFFNICSVFG